MRLSNDHLQQRLHSTRAAVERLVQRLGRPVATGRYEQRQRRRAQGVIAQRVQRLRRIERELVKAIEFVEFMESFGVETMP